MGSNNQCIPKVLMGVTPWWGSLNGSGSEGSHHPRYLQGESMGRNGGAGPGDGVRVRQS